MMTTYYELRKRQDDGSDVLLDMLEDPAEVIRRLNQYNLTRNLAGDSGIAYALLITLGTTNQPSL